MSTRIYIVEDHKIMRGALVQFIEDMPELEVAGAVETAEEALAQLDGEDVDLVLVDTRLPGMNGIELVGELKRRWPELRCLMLSGHSENTYYERALEAGAQGYVLKGDPDEIPAAIERVLGGGVYFSEPLQDGGPFER